MASENWLDPEWGTVSGLSGFASSRAAKLASSPGLARGLDMMEMTKDLVQEAYEAKRPDDGISGSRIAIIIGVETLPFDMIKDPVMKDLFETSDPTTIKEGITVVYAAPAGGSCSMLPKLIDPNDKASMYRFPRFYTFETVGSGEAGSPCEVSYLDEDTLSFGLFHKVSTNGIPIPTTEQYRDSSERQEARKAFNNTAQRSKLVSNVRTDSVFGFVSDSLDLANKSYHTSVLQSKNNPFGENGGGRIKNNVELNKKRDGVTTGLYSFGGRRRTIEKNTYNAYVAMVAQATKDGINSPLLQIRSAYRSVSHQTKLWERALRDPKNIQGAEELGIPLKSYARKYVAPPGRSRHHSGRALDFHLGYPISKSYISKMKATTAFAWLLQNAEFYGFYNYEAEPWHWEFNPDARIGRFIDRQAQKKSLEELAQAQEKSLEKLAQVEARSGVERSQKVYKPYAPETYALFEEAAFIAGVDPSWAQSRELHEILRYESGGQVGIPNYTFGRGKAGERFGRDIKARPEDWSEVHNEIKRCFARDERGKKVLDERGRPIYVGQVGRSSATGLGQLTGVNAEIFYPSGLQGIGDPLEEAVGMLKYIAKRRGSPKAALRFGLNDGFNKGVPIGDWGGY